MKRQAVNLDGCAAELLGRRTLRSGDVRVANYLKDSVSWIDTAKGK